MLDLISCYNENERQVLDKILSDSIKHIKCVFTKHYSTTIVLNRRHFILTTIQLDTDDITALVWELALDVKEPIIKTEIRISSAISFKNIIPDIVMALRKLQFLRNLETVPL